MPRICRAISVFVVVSMVFSISAIILNLSPARADETTNWCSQEPFPTGNDLFDICFAGSGTLYAVGGLDVGGGMKKSTIVKTVDGGDNWSILSAELGDDDVELRGVSAASQNIVWAVGEEGTIIKTTDGGATWQKQTSPTGETLMDVRAVSTTVAWAAGMNGALIKTTNGTEWSNQTAPIANEWFNSIDAIDSTHAWAVDSDARIIATTDGTNWSVQLDHSALQEWLGSVYVVNADIVYVAGQRWGDNLSSIYRTDNGGSAWNPVDPPPSTQQLLGICSTYGDDAWAVGNYGTILATGDGESWSGQTSPTQYTLNAVTADGITGYVWAVGNSGSIIRTLNGSDWTSLGISFTMQTWCVDAPDPNIAYVTSSDLVGWTGKLYRTSDAGANWQSVLDIPEPVFKVSAPQPGVAWVTGRSGSVWKVVEGQAPVNHPIPYDCWPLPVEALDDSTAWLLPNQSPMRIAKTTDGGATWTPQASPAAQTLNDISAVNSYVAFAVGNGGTIIKTTNGTDWALISPAPTTRNLISVSAVDASTAWAVGEDGTILKTENGGTDWDEQDSGVTGSIQGVSAIDSENAYAICGGPLKTTDGGETWTGESVPIFLSVGLTSVSAPARNAAWTVGGYSILHTHFIASISPGSAPAGSRVTLTGGGFGASQGTGFVTFGDTEAGGFGNWTDTEITTYVPDSTPAGPCQVRVHNRWGMTIPVDFTVDTVTAPDITLVNPDAGVAGEIVRIDGTNFGMPTDLHQPYVSFGGQDVQASDAVSWSQTRIDVQVPPGLPFGPNQLEVTAHDLQSNQKTFAVEHPAPRVLGINPAACNRGQTLSGATITGTDFRGPVGNVTALLKNGSETIIGTVTSVNSTQVTAVFTIPGGAAVGPWDVFVQLVDESKSDTLADAFDVQYPPPTFISISPNTAMSNGTVDIIDLKGTGFRAGASVHLARTGQADIQATNEAVVSSSKITCKIPVAGAAPGAWNVCVANDDGKRCEEAGAFTVRPQSVQSTWYLAEGTTAWGFSTYISIQNPSTTAVHAAITYMTGSGNVSGGTITLPASSQTTVNPAEKLGNKDFSTKVTCTEGRTIAVDRTMSWTGPGATSPEGHSSVGVTAPAKTWYLPEGCSAFGFECWLLIQNPNGGTATCTVTYMIEGEAPVTTTHTVGPNSRQSFNMETDIGQKNASIKVESNIPVIPERAMYRNNKREGHDSIGTTTAASDYFLAEGTTAWGFTTWVLIQNPGSSPSDVTITYMTPSGKKAQPSFSLAGNSRKTIKVNDVAGMANTDFSTQVHGSQPIIAERSMYWDNGTGEACHDSIGMSSSHTTFYLPDGETSNGRETWTLVQNPNESAITVEVSYLKAGGGAETLTSNIPANSRMTFNMADKVSSGRASITVTSKTAGKKIMVERAMYWNNKGAGTDTIGGFSD